MSVTNDYEEYNSFMGCPLAAAIDSFKAGEEPPRFLIVGLTLEGYDVNDLRNRFKKQENNHG